MTDNIEVQPQQPPPPSPVAEEQSASALPPEEAAPAIRPWSETALDNKWVQRLIVWGALLLVYELFALALGGFYLPRVGAIMQGFAEVAAEGRLLTLAGSLRQMLAGFGLAALVGIPVGLVIGMWRLVGYVVGMYINALFVTSLVALLPLLIIVFGVGFSFRIAVVFLFTVFFIILSTSDGVRSVDRALLWTAEAFYANAFRRFTSVVLPASMPFIVAGLRLGLANAFSGMVLAELWVVRDTGLVLTELGRNRNLPEFFALIFVITLIAALAAAALKALERRLMPWNKVG